MTLRHHPSDETLLRSAAGRLGGGPEALVAAHVETCAQCRARRAEFEALGGVLLADGPRHAGMALEKIFARIDAFEASGAEREAVRAVRGASPGVAAPGGSERHRLAAPEIDGLRLPRALAGAKIGSWRFVHPKLRWAKIALPGGDDRLLLLKLAPGFAVPPHAHGGLELTQVLSGCFGDDRGDYQPGDLVENDEESPSHQPRARGDRPCICLIAVERPLLMRSWAARLAQPLMGL